MRTAGSAAPGQRDVAHAGNLRQFLLQDIGGLVVDLAGRERLGGQRQDHDGEAGGIEFVVGGIGPQRSRQIRMRGADRRLDVARGAVDVAADVELQDHLGCCRRSCARSSR